MSATIFQTSPTADILDDRRRFHLDPWHKMLLGWTMPASIRWTLTQRHHQRRANRRR